MADDDAVRPKFGDAPMADGLDKRAQALPREESAPATGAGDEGAAVPSAPAPIDELSTLRAEVAAAEDRALRCRAELENLRKRALREKQEALRYGSEGLLKDLLPVVDNLQRALDHARTARTVEPIVEGIGLVLRSFAEALERHGVKTVEATGLPFDPSRHEALAHVESEAPANTVVGEYQRGYLLHDRLLRPAQVTVGKGPAGPKPDIERPGGDG